MSSPSPKKPKTESKCPPIHRSFIFHRLYDRNLMYVIKEYQTPLIDYLLSIYKENPTEANQKRLCDAFRAKHKTIPGKYTPGNGTNPDEPDVIHLYYKMDDAIRLHIKSCVGAAPVDYEVSKLDDLEIVKLVSRGELFLVF